MEYVDCRLDIGPTALINEAWYEWNVSVARTTTCSIQVQDPRLSGRSIEGVLYIDRRDRWHTPHLSPHAPLALLDRRDNRPREARDEHTWLELGGELADRLASRRFRTPVILPAGLSDGRPFVWAGLRVGVTYTYAGALPVDVTATNPSVRKNVRKAISRGYTTTRSDDWAGIHECLTATGDAKGFSHRIGIQDLELGASLMGEDSFRGYLVRDQRGLPVSGGVRVHARGHHAVDLFQGTQRRVLSDGVNQLMYDFVLRDLAEAGATGFDFCGADIPAVARAKSAWGLPLVPLLSVDGTGVAEGIRRAAVSSPFMVGLRQRIRSDR